MQRQAICTSPEELRRIADKLEKEYKESDPKISLDVKSVLPIINKTDESDTWEFER
jgi:hypothetical protein